MLSFAQLRCGIREFRGGFLMSSIRGAPGLSESFIIEPPIFLSHCCDVVLFVEVLLLFVGVDRFLVERLIETSLDIAAFPAPILSSAVEIQRLLDFVCA